MLVFALATALFGNSLAPSLGRVGVIVALALLVTLLLLRWIDLARHKRSPAFL